MEIKEETLRIIDLLNDCYESEEAWHGPSVVASLKDVLPRLAEVRISSNTHSIAEIVYHMTTWRIFVIRKLQGDTDFDVQALDKDWKRFNVVDDLEWEALQMELSLSQDELINELEQVQDDSFLEEVVPGRDYTFYTMLHGMIQHDLYHAGQISLLKRALSLRRLEEEDESDDYFEGNHFNRDFDIN